MRPECRKQAEAALGRKMDASEEQEVSDRIAAAAKNIAYEIRRNAWRESEEPRTEDEALAAERRGDLSSVEWHQLDSAEQNAYVLQRLKDDGENNLRIGLGGAYNTLLAHVNRMGEFKKAMDEHLVKNRLQALNWALSPNWSGTGGSNIEFTGLAVTNDARGRLAPMFDWLTGRGIHAMVPDDAVGDFAKTSSWSRAYLHERERALMAALLSEDLDHLPPAHVNGEPEQPLFPMLDSEHQAQRSAEYASAARFAHDWKQVSDGLRGELEAAGTKIPYRRNWAMPQYWDKDKVAQIPEEEFINDIMNYSKEALAPLSREEARTVRAQILVNPANDFLADLSTTAQRAVSDPTYGLSYARAVSFANSSARMEAMAKYGSDNSFAETMDNDLMRKGLALAATRYLGPNPGRGFVALLDDAARADAGDITTAHNEAVARIAQELKDGKITQKQHDALYKKFGKQAAKGMNAVTVVKNRTQSLWDQISGERDVPESRAVGKVFTSTRAALGGLHLGSAVFSTVQDIVPAVQVLLQTHMFSIPDILAAHAKLLPDKGAMRNWLRAEGYGVEQFVTATKRMVATSSNMVLPGKNVPGSIQSAVIRGSGLNAVTRVERQIIADIATRRLADMVQDKNPDHGKWLSALRDAYGISQNDWRIWNKSLFYQNTAVAQAARAVRGDKLMTDADYGARVAMGEAAPYEYVNRFSTSPDGAPRLSRRAIELLGDEPDLTNVTREEAMNASRRLLAMVTELMYSGSPEATARTLRLTQGTLGRRGTVGGETTRSALQFMNTPIFSFMTAAARAWNPVGYSWKIVEDRPQLLALRALSVGLLIAASAASAYAVDCMKNFISGKEPPPLNAVNAARWTTSAIPFISDFANAVPYARTGSDWTSDAVPRMPVIQLPLSLLASGYDAGAALNSRPYDARKYKLDLARQLYSNLIPNFWITRPFAQNQIKMALYNLADPQYARRAQRFQQRQGQQYYPFFAEPDAQGTSPLQATP
jgi:hypothetical protein